MAVSTLHGFGVLTMGAAQQEKLGISGVRGSAANLARKQSLDKEGRYEHPKNNQKGERQ